MTRWLRRVGSALALMSALLVAAGPASARSARALLRSGNKLFAQGRYARAYSVFAKGYARAKSPVFLRSMALCRLKQYKHAEARKLYRDYVAKFPKAKDVAKVRTTVTKLDTIVETRVKVTSNPPGAKVFIDTESSGVRGVTPFEGTLEAGTHTVLLKKDGFRLTSKTFAVKERKTADVAVTLEVPLSVTTQPSGAQVRIDSPDGKSIGTTPLKDGGVPLGDHKIYIKAKGYKMHVASVSAKAGGRVSISNIALKLGLRVTSVPSGASVSIDGKPAGKTPLDVAAAPGKHSVAVSMTGFDAYKTVVNVAPGADSSVTAKLRGGLLSMRTGPVGAAVRVGGLTIGKTPLDKAVVPIGKHSVEVRHPDRSTFVRRLAFDNSHLLDADITLGRSSWPMWTGVGVGVAAAVVGIVAGAVALSKRSDANDSVAYGPNGATRDGWCDSSGNPATFGDANAFKDQALTDQVSSSDCGYGIHHVATAGIVTAGIAGAFALAYYLIWVRPSVEIQRRKRAERRRRMVAAARARVAAWSAAHAAKP